MLKDALLLHVFRMRLVHHRRRSDRVCILPEELLVVWKNQGEECADCWLPFEAINFEIDHIIPIHKGGFTSADNLQFLCVECHKHKTGIELSNRENPATELWRRRRFEREQIRLSRAQPGELVVPDLAAESAPLVK